MATLVYTPGIQILVSTLKDGILDLTDDITSGTLVLRENGSHTFNVTLNNPYRKYEGVFTPNDRVVIQMKRIKWLQVFSGYLTVVPMYSTYPQQITITGECGLKILRNWPWDETTTKAINLKRTQYDPNSGQDGGMSQLITNILTKVVGWPADHIHIGAVPSEWIDRFKTIYDTIAKETQDAEQILSSNPTIAGQAISPTAPSTTTPGGAGGTSGAADGEEPVSDADIPIVMANIRTMESNNNYQAPPNQATASGAYQFIDTTWSNYQGYPHAYLAPPSVQDTKAIELIQIIFKKYGNKLINVPLGWYWPAVFGDPSWMDRVPQDKNGNTWGNTKTLRQYATMWLASYATVYQNMKGQPYYSSPTSGGSVPGTVNTSPSSTNVLTPGDPTQAYYPIPASTKDGLDPDKSAWGGFENGKVDASAMKSSPQTGQGYPHAVDAWDLLCQEASKYGYDMSGGMYRNYDAQVQGDAGQGGKGTFGVPGHSNHGWGLAIDIKCLIKNPRIDQFNSPEYIWLQSNAWRYGFVNPTWAQPGGSNNPNKLEPWHWEFAAFPNFPLSVTGPQPGQGANPFDSSALNISGLPGNSTLFDAVAWWRASQDIQEGLISDIMAYGYRALINDSPVLATIQALVAAAGRSFCMAPNGDFISWFPDYWDEFGLAGKINIELIELQDFSVDWDDTPLITHQYVEGSSYSGVNYMSPLPNGIRNYYNVGTTGGVATVDMPRFLEAVIGKQIDQIPFMADPQQLLTRFGARVSNKNVMSISGQQQEFWMAVREFIQHWTDQFSAYIPVTFMPELFPGMIMAIPDLKIQFYVSTVTHNWDFTNGVGFTTSVNVKAPSGTDGSGFILFPRGGIPPKPSTARIIRT